MIEENKAEAQPAQVQMVIQIIRANTGKVEEYTLTGTVEQEPQWQSPTQ